MQTWLSKLCGDRPLCLGKRSLDLSGARQLTIQAAAGLVCSIFVVCANRRQKNVSTAMKKDIPGQSGQVIGFASSANNSVVHELLHRMECQTEWCHTWYSAIQAFGDASSSLSLSLLRARSSKDEWRTNNRECGSYTGKMDDLTGQAFATTSTNLSRGCHGAV